MSYLSYRSHRIGSDCVFLSSLVSYDDISFHLVSSSIHCLCPVLCCGPLLHPQPQVHLSFDEFCEWLATDALLVQAFLGRILQTMETVYKRNKRISTNLYVAAKNL